MNKTIVSDQGNTYDGHGFFSDNVNIWNLEEYIQNSLTEKSPKVQDKISPTVSKDKTVEKLVIPKRDLQNFGKKELTNFQNVYKICSENLIVFAYL